MSRYDSDDLRRVSSHLPAGVGLSRTRPFPVGGLRGLICPAPAVRLAHGGAPRGGTPGHYRTAGGGAGAGERTRLCPARGWHYLCVPVADQAALPAGLRPDAVRNRCGAAWHHPGRRRRSGDGRPDPARGGRTAPAVGPAAHPGQRLDRTAHLVRALRPGRALGVPGPGPARRRGARGLAALRGLPARSDDAVLERARAAGDLAEVGRWLEEFQPFSLVERDYGGLVHLVS